MARMTKKLAPPSLAKRKKKGASALATRLRKQIRARKQAERDAMLPMVIAKPVTKRRKSTTRRKKTTTAAATSSVISPICRRAGRKLKTTASPSAGATLGSKRCKTKSSGSTTTTATKRRTTRKTTATATRKTTTRKTTAKKTSTRKSSASSKLARIKRIVC